MKRILFSIAIFSGIAVHAQEPSVPVEQTDTVINIVNPSTIVLSENPDGINLIITDADGSNTTYNYTHPDPGNVSISSVNGHAFDSGHTLVINSWKKSKTTYNLVSGGINFGKNFAMGQPEPLDISTGKSWEISWICALGVRISHGKNSFTTGIGFNWRNYKMTGPYQFVKRDGAINISEYPDGADGRWSSLKVTTLSVPLIYERHIWKGINFAGGAIVNLATHSSIKTKFFYEGREIETVQSGIYPRPVTVDIYGAISVCGLGWYVRYSPMKVIRDGRGPQFSTLSTGVTLGF